MQIAVLGTGVVGRTVGGRLTELGHDVVIGTRDPARTLAVTEPDARGQVPFRAWFEANGGVRLATFSQAASSANVVVDALLGVRVLKVLEATDAEALEGKVLLDLTLPLKRHEGQTPSLTSVEDESLAEQIQAAHPELRVVKSLNTVAAPLMVDPARVPGDHVVFLSGDDDDAKETVLTLLRQFGWAERVIHDLGGIRSARGREMYSYLLFELAATFGSFDFNIGIHRAHANEGRS